MKVKKWTFISLIFCIIFIPLVSVLVSLTDLKYLNKVLVSLHSAPKDNVIYFADSIMKSSAVCETDKRGLDNYLSEKITQKVIAVNHSAYSPIIYRSLIPLIKNTKLAIIPINIRMFSEEWYKKPQYQFYKQRIFLKVMDFDLSFLKEVFTQLLETDEEYFNLRINRLGDDIGSVSDLLKKNTIPVDFYCTDKKMIEIKKYKSQLVKKYKFHYMYDLAPTHIMFKYLREMIQKAKESSVPMLFYITPINYEYGTILMGNQFQKIVKSNINILKKFLIQENVKVLDFSRLVDNKKFIETHLVCEHIDKSGKEIIAQKVSEYINKNIK